MDGSPNPIISNRVGGERYHKTYMVSRALFDHALDEDGVVILSVDPIKPERAVLAYEALRINWLG